MVLTVVRAHAGEAVAAMAAQAAAVVAAQAPRWVGARLDKTLNPLGPAPCINESSSLYPEFSCRASTLIRRISAKGGTAHRLRHAPPPGRAARRAWHHARRVRRGARDLTGLHASMDCMFEGERVPEHVYA